MHSTNFNEYIEMLRFSRRMSFKGLKEFYNGLYCMLFILINQQQEHKLFNKLDDLIVINELRGELNEVCDCIFERAYNEDEIDYE